MKAYLNLINQQKFPRETSKNLQQLVMNHDIEMVFLSREYFCSVSAIIVILGKAAKNTIQKMLQHYHASQDLECTVLRGLDTSF